jgi:hypothetical protein
VVTTNRWSGLKLAEVIKLTWRYTAFEILVVIGTQLVGVTGSLCFSIATSLPLPASHIRTAWFSQLVECNWFRSSHDFQEPGGELSGAV